jgi:hypothetical protein
MHENSSSGNTSEKRSARLRDRRKTHFKNYGCGPQFGQLVVLPEHKVEVLLSHDAWILYTVEVVEDEFDILPA